MNLEFVTGLLLVLALLGALGYILKELFSTMRLDLPKVSLSDALARQRNTEPAPINAHLVGMSGEVVRLNDDGDRPLTVRLGLERWPARLAASASGDGNGNGNSGGEGEGDATGGSGRDSEAGMPSVGDSVIVTAVAGPVLVVRSAD